MRRLIIAAALGMIAAAAPVRAADPPKNEVKQYITTDLTGDPTRHVRIQQVMLPPGADTGRHFHYGDQYTMVQEGEVVLTIDGQAPRTLKAGAAAHIDPKVIHRNQNLSDKPARTVEVFIDEKDKPPAERLP